MAPTGQAHLDITLAVLCSAGGLMGFIKKKSVPSLIAGLGFGAAYGTSAYLITSVDARQGHTLGAAASAFLSTAMGIRFARTKKLMPAGLLAGVGVFGLLYHLKKGQEWA